MPLRPEVRHVGRSSRHRRERHCFVVAGDVGFDRLECFRVKSGEARRRPDVARSPRDFDGRVVDDFLHLRQECIEILVRKRPHVEARFRFRGDDVDAVAALDDRRRDRRPQHRRVTRLAIEEVIVGSRGGGGVGADDAQVALRVFGRGDRRQTLEVGARRVVEPDRAASTRPPWPRRRARCTTAFDLSGTDPWPEMPRAVSSIARGIFSSVWIDANLTWPPARDTLPPSARQYSASICGKCCPVMY